MIIKRRNLKTTIDSDEMKACPFCGENEKMALKEVSNPSGVLTRKYFQIQCKCGAASSKRLMKHDAVHEWNIRSGK